MGKNLKEKNGYEEVLPKKIVRKRRETKRRERFKNEMEKFYFFQRGLRGLKQKIIIKKEKNARGLVCLILDEEERFVSTDTDIVAAGSVANAAAFTSIATITTVAGSAVSRVGVVVVCSTNSSSNVSSNNSVFYFLI